MKKLLSYQAGPALVMLAIVLLAGVNVTAPAEESRQKKPRIVQNAVKDTQPAVSPVPLADESLIDPNAPNGRRKAKAQAGQREASREPAGNPSKKKNARR